MVLTKEQLQHINNYLDVKGITYIDVRYEILDHICIEIEMLMQNNYSFDEACNTIETKWNNELRETSSYMLGLAYVKPKPIIKKTVSFMKKYIYGIWGLFVLNMIAIGFALKITLSHASFIDLTCKIIAAISALVILANYYQIHKSRIKTTYKFVYQSQILPGLLFVVILGFGIINQNGNIEVLKLIFLSHLLITIPISFKLTKSHLKAIKQYKMLWN